MQQKKTRIKICGLTSEEEIRWVLEENVDYLGMVLFFPKSKRNISIERAKQLLAVDKHMQNQVISSEAKNKEQDKLPKTVAVTVSPTPEQVKEIEQAGFDLIQIHGELTKETYEAVTIPIIRAIQVKDGALFVSAGNPAGNKDTEAEISGTEDKIVAYLLDAPAPGSGKSFDWDVLMEFPRNDKMIFLAGGLNSENVREAIAKGNPDVVDVSSGVEIDTKIVGKDRNKIKEFVRKVETNE